MNQGDTFAEWIVVQSIIIYVPFKPIIWWLPFGQMFFLIMASSQEICGELLSVEY